MSVSDMSLSYYHKPDEKPLQWLTIPQQIDHWAEIRPDQEAYVVRQNGKPRESVTFSQLKEKTQNLAAGLLDLGICPGDFVLISGVTCMNWILVDLACASIGVHTIRCLMSTLSKEGLLNITNTNKVKALIYHPGESGEFEQHLVNCIPDAFQNNEKQNKFCEDIPSLQQIISLATSDSSGGKVQLVDDLISACLSLDDVQSAKSRVHPDTILTVFMSSGSTGFPKAIPHTHFMMINTLFTYTVLHKSVGCNDRFFNERSLAWIASFICLPLAHGLCNVYLHPLLSAKEYDIEFAIEVMQDEKVTCGMIFQYFIADINEWIQVNGKVPFKLKWAITGGEVILPSSIETLSKVVADVAVVYGATECGVMAGIFGTKNTQKHIQYAGIIEPRVEVKIVDENGDVVPLGEQGEIVVRSPLAFRGYLQSEVKGMAIDRNGWISTDDAGCLEAGGLLKVFGRKSHVISRGIAIVYPTEIERVITQFPGIAKVSVIGVPDKRLGQNICACIIPEAGMTLTSDDLLRRFAELYKTDEGLGMTPAYFLFLESFPVVNAKVDRKKLLSIAVEKFGLSLNVSN